MQDAILRYNLHQLIHHAIQKALEDPNPSKAFALFANFFPLLTLLLIGRRIAANTLLDAVR